MASNNHLKRRYSSTTYFYVFISIISITAFFILSSHYLTSYSTPPILLIESLPPINQYDVVNDNEACDLAQGKWFYDSTVRSTRYDETCKEIYKGWNCIAGNRSGAKEILKWRWQPDHCALPLFDPLRFLESHKDISIGKNYS